MKKYILILLVSLSFLGASAQAEFPEGINLAGNVVDDAATYVTVQSANGDLNKVAKSSIKSPIATATTTGTVKITTGEVDPVVYTKTVVDNLLSSGYLPLTGGTVGFLKIPIIASTNKLMKFAADGTLTPTPLSDASGVLVYDSSIAYGYMRINSASGGSALFLQGDNKTFVQINGEISSGTNNGKHIIRILKNNVLTDMLTIDGATSTLKTPNTIEMAPAVSGNQAVTLNQLNAAGGGGSSSTYFTPSSLSNSVLTLNFSECTYTRVGNVVTMSLIISAIYGSIVSSTSTVVMPLPSGLSTPVTAGLLSTSPLISLGTGAGGANLRVARQSSTSLTFQLNHPAVMSGGTYESAATFSFRVN